MVDEKYTTEFLELTDMLPPDKDENLDYAGQLQFTRQEVREMLWKMYIWGKNRALDKRNAHA